MDCIKLLQWYLLDQGPIITYYIAQNNTEGFPKIKKNFGELYPKLQVGGGQDFQSVWEKYKIPIFYVNWPNWPF